MTNLATNVLWTAARYPGRVALRLDDSTLDYRALDDASARVAALMRGAGVRPGDRVGLMLPNVIEFAPVYYGILRAGAVVVPMNPLLKRREVAYYLADAGASLALVWQTAADEAVAGAAAVDARCLVVEPDQFAGTLAATAPDREVADRGPADTAVILYTSGTTGQPKGAELTHENLRRNVEVSNGTLLRLGPDDVVFGGLPLFHSFGQTVALNCAVAAGATLTLLPRFDPGRALQILARDRVTVFLGVPTMYAALLRQADRSPVELTALRLCVSGGAALPVEVLRAFEARFDCVILEGYGLSETSPVACFNHPDQPRKPGTIGTPIDGVQMRVVDDAGTEVAAGTVGEIAVRGHNVMKGYWRRPEAIVDGWFRTGDLGTRDDDGYFRIVDRKKEMLIRGGFNVYPREVEEVLYEHPAVAEAAVIGIPDDVLGEEVGAAVALKPGASATAEELRAFVRDRLAPYKYPRRVWLVDALPKGATGKILKREIRSSLPVD